MRIRTMWVSIFAIDHTDTDVSDQRVAQEVPSIKGDVNFGYNMHAPYHNSEPPFG